MFSRLKSEAEINGHLQAASVTIRHFVIRLAGSNHFRFYNTERPLQSPGHRIHSQVLSSTVVETLIELW